MFYERVADLELEIDGFRLEPQSLATGGGWTRHTTVIRLRGRGVEGLGEDVTYQNPDQARFQREGSGLALAGRYTLEGFSRKLDALELFSAEPEERFSRLLRRWGFESAALDLAAKQSACSLAARLERTPRPVRFVVSLGLGDPPSTRRIRHLVAADPGLRFKVDYAENWTRQTVDELAELGVVEVVDFKGHYHGAFRGPAADARLYSRVADALPEARLEDPAWNDDTAGALAAHRERIGWDAPIHSLADVEQLPFPPRHLNIKPSRFGLLSELLRVYELCEARGIAMYGGGQFELGPGRGQIQLLASLFHPDGPNDVAPADYNREPLPERLTPSPLPPATSAAGFSWDP